MKFRKANLDTFTKKYGVKLSFMSPFLKAVANALTDQPVINGVISGTDIIYRLLKHLAPVMFSNNVKSFTHF